MAQITVSVFIRKANMSEASLLGELTHTILNATFEVHNDLGCRFVEKVYKKSLIRELKIGKKRVFETSSASVSVCVNLRFKKCCFAVSISEVFVFL